MKKRCSEECKGQQREWHMRPDPFQVMSTRALLLRFRKSLNQKTGIEEWLKK